MFFRSKRKLNNEEQIEINISKKSRCESVSICSLPAELIDHIAMHLGFSELLALCSTSKLLYSKTLAHQRKFKFSLISSNKTSNFEGTFAQIRELLNSQYNSHKLAQKYKKIIYISDNYLCFSNVLSFYIFCFLINYANKNFNLPYGTLLQEGVFRFTCLFSSSYNLMNMFRISSPFSESIDDKLKRIEKNQFKVIIKKP